LGRLADYLAGVWSTHLLELKALAEAHERHHAKKRQADVVDSAHHDRRASGDHLHLPSRIRRRFGAGWATAARFVPGRGGAFRVAYPNGDVAAGVVEEIVPNERIVMSWGYESGAMGIPAGATRVEIVLVAVPGGTRVTLRHTGLRDAAQRANHRAGWRHHLASLSHLTSAALDGIMGGRIDDYTAAWARGPRRANAGCSGSAGIETAYSATDGVRRRREDLADYIGMAQRFSPGITLERHGAIFRAHAFASYRWRMIAPNGAAIMTGSTRRSSHRRGSFDR